MEGRCNATTKKGTPCTFLAEECPHRKSGLHRERETGPAAMRTSAALDFPSPPPAARQGPTRIARAFAERDLRGVLWEVLESLVMSDAEGKTATAAASIARAIASLGEETGDREQSLRETAVIGSVMHGIPPRDAAQWAIAERLFDAETVRALREWDPLDGWFSTLAGPLRDAGSVPS